MIQNKKVKHNAGGEFELFFKTEREYVAFGMDYAKCYGNVSVEGEFIRPIPSGKLKYRVKFDLECGCSSVLFEFNKAYNKTFGDEISSSCTPVDNAAYTAEMIVCSLGSAEKYIKSLQNQIDDADEFFDSSGLTDFGLDTSPYADKDGLVQFIVAGPLLDDKKLMKKLQKYKNYLISLTSIVTAKVNDIAEKKGPHYKTDPKTWEEVISHLPLMGPGTIDTKKYDRNIHGIEIAKNFIEFMLDAVVSEETGALSKFKQFLEKQGKSINFGIENNTDSYKTNTLGVIIEAYKIGGEVVIVPKICQFQINFTRTNSRWVSLCASGESVRITFDYKYSANVFDYQALKDDSTEKKFKEFITKTRNA